MSGTAKPKKGDNVEYKWGKGTVEAEVKAVHTGDVERKIKGKTIKRKGSTQEPVVEVETKKGGHALKSASEIKKT